MRSAANQFGSHSLLIAICRVMISFQLNESTSVDFQSKIKQFACHSHWHWHWFDHKMHTYLDMCSRIVLTPKFIFGHALSHFFYNKMHLWTSNCVSLILEYGRQYC